MNIATHVSNKYRLYYIYLFQMLCDSNQLIIFLCDIAKPRLRLQLEKIHLWHDCNRIFIAFI
jgi:hypothetical protein